MRIKENQAIFRYLNSGNVTLSIEAQLAWIQLNPDDPLSFYDDPNVKLTQWGQLNLLLALKKGGRIPDFGRWLTSMGKSVSLFALKMAGNYKQFENVELVTQRLDDDDQEIRREAICALGKMVIPSKATVLQQLFPKEELENKTEIIRSLIMMSESSNASFFEEALLNETDVNLRILSAKGLVSLGNAGMSRLNLLLLNADELLKKIIIHAKDNRI
jgi:HEAT repeat protein